MIKKVAGLGLTSSVLTLFCFFVVSNHVCHGQKDTATKPDEKTVTADSKVSRSGKKDTRSKVVRSKKDVESRGIAGKKGIKPSKSSKRIPKKRVPVKGRKVRTVTGVLKLGEFDKTTGNIASFKTAAANLSGFIDTKLAGASKDEMFDLYKSLGVFRNMVGRSKFATPEHYAVVNDLLKHAVDNSSKFKMKAMAKNIGKWQKDILNESNNKELQQAKIVKEEKFKKIRAERKTRKKAGKKPSASKPKAKKDKPVIKKDKKGKPADYKPKTERSAEEQKKVEEKRKTDKNAKKLKKEEKKAKAKNRIAASKPPKSKPAASKKGAVPQEPVKVSD